MVIICGWCGSDVDVEYDEANDLALCTGPGHDEPRMFEPKQEAAAKKAHAQKWNGLTDGIAAGLGLYEDLPGLLVEGEWADTMVVEYRYGEKYPGTYRELLKRWGHTAQGSRKYSTTSFIGSTLGQLSRATSLTYKPGKGSGFFAYNSTVGFWTLEPVPESTTDVSWKAFAIGKGIDSATWPLL